MKADQGNNLSEMVYHYLLDMILSMKIKPGDRIPEARIATQFGISRTPIRDAMKQLANDGILNIYPNRFAEVANWDEDLIKEIGITRAHLDNLAAKLAQAGATQLLTLSLHMAGFNEALPAQPDATIATINALLGWVPAAVTFVMLAVLCAMNIEKDMDSMNAEKAARGISVSG